MALTINLGDSPGYKFRPEKHVLIGFYLKKRLLGQTLPAHPKIIEDDVYRDHPYNLFQATKVARAVQDHKHDSEGYFFTTLKTLTKNGTKIRRCAGNWGVWKEHGIKDVTVYDKSSKSIKLIGIHKYYKFMPTLGKNLEENDGTDWQMHEYSVMNRNDIVLCHIVAKNSKKRDYDTMSLSDYEYEQSNTSCVEDCSKESSSSRLQSGAGGSIEGCSSTQLHDDKSHQQDDNSLVKSLN